MSEQLLSHLSSVRVGFSPATRALQPDSQLRKRLLCVQENTGGEAAFREEQGDSDWETGEDDGDDDDDGVDED